MLGVVGYGVEACYLGTDIAPRKGSKDCFFDG